MCLRWLALFFQHYVLKIISSYVADSFSLPHSPLLYKNITIYFYRWPTFAPFPGFAVTTLLLWTFLWCLLVYRCQILRGCPQEGPCRAAGKGEWVFSSPREHLFSPVVVSIHTSTEVDEGFQFTPWQRLTLRSLSCGCETVSSWFEFAFLIPNEVEHLSVSYWAVCVPSTVRCPCAHFSTRLFLWLIDSLWILKSHTLSVHILQKLLMVSFEEKIFIILM